MERGRQPLRDVVLLRHLADCLDIPPHLLGLTAQPQQLPRPPPAARRPPPANGLLRRRPVGRNGRGSRGSPRLSLAQVTGCGCCGAGSPLQPPGRGCSVSGGIDLVPHQATFALS
ncbi:hypothetical protein LZF96_02555 [Streptomyces sp. ST2-7A]|nr:hypothetical protein [Streptomyces sp. ST2-7A]